MPAFTETGQPGLALFPTNAHCMCEFPESMMGAAITEIIANIFQPSQQDGASPVKLSWFSSPDCGQGFSLTMDSLIRLGRSVVMRVHNYGIRAVNNFVAL